MFIIIVFRLGSDNSSPVSSQISSVLAQGICHGMRLLGGEFVILEWFFISQLWIFFLATIITTM